MKRTDTCYTCRFWEGLGMRGRGPKGVCRRFPPVVTPRNPDGRFPLTLTTDWCGEWRRETGQAGAETDTRDRTIYDDLTG
ncbi:hypothetical protein HL658_05925 [Azospirillum sp. RWY-5-1]|uniref:Uracil-DNA glycosylase n=1 Tax=Azospirillum oleiclasticum TaxID=2735135 RepID=A0ABX2T5X7_9PROT|nr:hypothetical protein [Azospirillum oleiclasticum]NYZ12080.1 hypothetical protein [Azospirillum oleiclasticum]NYZ19240.1 hypothetical protein [Azospirillum oleiclasticum]